MAFDPREIFGESAPEPQAGQQKNMLLALVLQLLQQLMQEERKEDPSLDPRERDAREIHVRPRVEPLGGA